jgi:hypothetical protein
MALLVRKWNYTGALPEIGPLEGPIHENVLPFTIASAPTMFFCLPVG